jgi:REP element-mobilizing transposase RayT
MALTFAKRKTLRLKDFDYSQPGAYFVTICVRNKRCLLGSIADSEMRLSRYGLMAAESWEWLSSAYKYVVLDAWTIMPNHLHGIIFINQPCRGGSRAAPTSEFKIKPLGQIIGAFKSISTKQINIHQQMPGIPFWQRGFHEHVIRHEESLIRIRDYIATNPLRWELDRENPQATGNDDFDAWLGKFQPRPTTQDIVL